MNCRTIVAHVYDSRLDVTVSGSADDLLQSDPGVFVLQTDPRSSVALYNLLCHEALMDGYIETPEDVARHNLDILELLGNLEPFHVTMYNATWRFYDYI